MFSIYGNKDKKVIPPGKLNDLLSFEAIQYVYNTTTASDGETTIAVEATKINLEACGVGNNAGQTIDGTTYTGRSPAAVSPNAYCTVPDQTSETKQEMYLVGADTSEIYAFIQINVNQCDSTDVNCLYYFYGATGDDIDAKIAEYEVINQNIPTIEKDKWSTANTVTPQDRIGPFQNFIKSRIEVEYQSLYLTFSYPEAALVPDNYGDPFQYNLISTIRTYTSIDFTKYINIFFREIEVQSDKGIFTEDYEVKSSYGFDTVLSDTGDRGFGSAKPRFIPGQKEAQTVSAPIVVFNMYSSNNKNVYVRKYSKIVDVFSNVGGIAGTVGFVISLLYAWYNGLRMEQNMLNYGVLGKEPDVKYEAWEKSRFFSTFEIFLFKFFSICLKKTAKYQLYEKSSDTFQERTDVVNIMKNIMELNSIKDAICKPYQIKLFAYVKEQDGDEGKYVNPRTAVDNLLNKDSTTISKSEKSTTAIRVLMDAYIQAHLPKEMLNNNFEALDINKKGSKNDKNKIFPEKGLGDDTNEEKWLNRINTPDQSAIHHTGEGGGLNIAKAKALHVRKRDSIFSRESRQSNDGDSNNKAKKSKKIKTKRGGKLRKENTDDGKSKINEI